MWFAYLYRRGATASEWIPDPDEVAAATTEAECVTGILEPPWDITYELGVDPLPDQIPDIRPQVPVPVPRLFARLDTDDWTGQTYEYVGVVENPTAPPPQPPNPLPRAPLEEHSVQAIHLLPPIGNAGQLLALDGSRELTWQDPATTGLADGSVTNPKLAANAVTGDKIANGTITGVELSAGTITADKLAAGVIPAPPGIASDSTPGLIAIETTSEVLAGADQTKALTIGRLLARTATPTRLGLIRTATPAAMVEGTNDTDAATPAGVKAAIQAIPAIPNGSEATPGLLRIASQPTVNTGLDDTQAVSSLKLATRLAAIPVASPSQPSLVQLSSTPETVTGTNNTHATTPEGVKAAINAIPVASTSQPSLVQLSPPAETVTGTNTTNATHPAGVKAALDTRVPSGTPLSVPRYAASGQSLESSSLTIDAASNFRFGAVVPGTGAQRVLTIPAGVGPTGSHPPDAVQTWVEDVDGVAGSASLLIRGEQGVLTIIGNGIMGRYNARTVSTNGVSTPLVLTADMSGKLLLCNNGTEIAGLQLPSPSLGVYYTIINNQGTPRGTRIMAAAGHVIRLGTVSSAPGGYVQTQTIGDVLVLIGISGTIWQAINPPPGWTVGV